MSEYAIIERYGGVNSYKDKGSGQIFQLLFEKECIFYLCLNKENVSVNTETKCIKVYNLNAV